MNTHTTLKVEEPVYRAELSERGLSADVWSLIALLIDLSPATHRAPLQLGAALYEGAYDGRLTLRARGTVERPAWTVYLAESVSEGDEFPSLLRKASQAWLKVSELTDDSNLAEPDGLEGFHDYMNTKWAEENPLAWSDTFQYTRPRARMKGDSRQPAHQGWPPWLQVPVLPLADGLREPPVRVLGGDEEADDVNEATLRYLLAARKKTVTDGQPVLEPAVINATDNGATLAESVRARLGTLQREANRNLADALIDPPELKFGLGSPESWLEGHRPTWQFRETPRSDWLRVAALSSAQRRWANLAIGLATGRAHGTPEVFLCDEPEAGLHRLAERHLALGLHKLFQRTGVHVLVATHSPQLLDAYKMQPVFVRRDSEGAVATGPVSLSLLDRTSAERSGAEHGLGVGDLTSLMRLAMVVEGLHDELVFSALLRESLDSALAGIMPLHGGRYAASLADARLLYDGTDAEILLVLDNLDHAHVSKIWSRVKSQAAAGDLAAARQSLEQLDRRSTEQLFLHQLGVRALDVGTLQRVHIFGLSMPDVICYLPPELLLDSPRPWNDLVRQWTEEAAPKPAQNLKRWLKTHRLLSDDPEEINRRIADAAVTVRRRELPLHEDLTHLTLQIADLASRRPAT